MRALHRSPRTRSRRAAGIRDDGGEACSGQPGPGDLETLDTVDLGADPL
ncbi:hypothetical protein ACRAWC_24365 [Leifsonia sp. L25]